MLDAKMTSLKDKLNTPVVETISAKVAKAVKGLKK